MLFWFIQFCTVNLLWRTVPTAAGNLVTLPARQGNLQNVSRVTLDTERQSESDSRITQRFCCKNSDLLRSDDASTELKRIRSDENTGPHPHPAPVALTKRYASRWTWQHGSLSFSELMSVPFQRNSATGWSCQRMLVATKPSEPEFMQVLCRTKQARILSYCCWALGTAPPYAPCTTVC